MPELILNQGAVPAAKNQGSITEIINKTLDSLFQERRIKIDQ